jgi:ribosomal protein S12 methylthiotransferase
MNDALPLPLLDAAPADAAAAAARSARLRAALGRPVRYYLVTLGCPKNVVDSETFERRLRALGCAPAPRPADADVLVVNTCGFIEQSQAESIAAILDLAARRTPGQTLLTAGCLVTLHRDELARELPEVDAFFNPHQWDDALARVAAHGLRPGVPAAALAAAAERIRAGTSPALALDGLYEAHVLAELVGREPSSPPPGEDAMPPAPFDIPRAGPVGAGRVSAYLKIADGCNAPCTFCIIPRIKGPLTSARPPDLLAQARLLRQEGARELVLVAQDTTAYAQDLGVRDGLPDLLCRLAEAVPDVWLRVMYAYPGRVSRRLIRTMAALPQVVHYLDVPLQHGAASTLRRMRRPSNLTMVRRMIDDLREAMPDIALRTSFIVGFPGETEAEFAQLLDFVAEIRFDHVGVFTYSRQDQAPAAGFPGQVPERVGRRRRRQVMELQQTISLAKHRALVGQELTVLVEGTAVPPGRGGSGPRRGPAGGAEPVFVGRAYRDAPEVDGLVICRGRAAPGTFVRVRVTDALPYDLVAERIDEGGP